MRQWGLALLLCMLPIVAWADQTVVIQWLAGNCSDAFRVYRSTAKGWVEVAEVTETQLEIVVPSRDVRWRVSGICLSGSNKGEWWTKQGVWTGANVFKDVRK